MFALKMKPVANDVVPWFTVDIASTQSEVSAHLARLPIGRGMQAAVFDGEQIVEGPVKGSVPQEQDAEAEADAMEPKGGW